MNELANHYVGHVRIFENGEKFYLAKVRINNQSRWTARKLDTASAAELYGKRLVARYEALKKVTA